MDRNERARRSYSPEVKRAMVEEIESGQLSIREAAVRGHTSVNQIRLWIDEFGKYKPRRDIVEVVMKSEEDRIRELEKALADSTLKNVMLEKIVELASKKYKTDLKKSIGWQQSSGEESKNREAPASYARRSGEAETLITNNANEKRIAATRRNRS
jgi:transposase